MDVFSSQRRKRLIQRWQRFLTAQRLYFGPTDGVDSQEFRNSVQAFQHSTGLLQNGDIDDSETLAAAHGCGFDRDFEIGPDHDGDLRESRPYFVVPLDKDAMTLQEACDRITTWACAAAGREASFLLSILASTERKLVLSLRKRVLLSYGALFGQAELVFPPKRSMSAVPDCSSARSLSNHALFRHRKNP